MSLILPILLFVLGVGFTLYPILPGALFAFLGILAYGLFEGWTAFPVWFWVLQVGLVLLNFFVDWITSVLGIKRVGGSKEAIWGTIIGMIAGPFLLTPFIGIIAGPVLGAMIGEFLHIRNVGQIAKVGVATLLGSIIGTFIKLLLVLCQVGFFFQRIW